MKLKNVPDALKNKKELQTKLEQIGLIKEGIAIVLSFSHLP
ncbi:MAG TPA: hypothetical protein VEL11_02235 [Candidatus Bathyarchaeia archaeon]|nr:hypothetical protein [Candidatus Bathyarchaeia archaeon]